jgi:hypothetical protein
MPNTGHRHRLVLYTYMLNRWWKLILAIGLFLLALSLELQKYPIPLTQHRVMTAPQWLVLTITGSGIYAVLLAVALFFFRKSAYIQPFSNHLKLATPFLRMNISYQRIQKTSSVEIQHLFAINRYRGDKEKLLRTLAPETAIVLEMRGWPLPRWVLGFFLSPLFFPDKSSRLALLVPNWMECSLEIENFRSAWISSKTKPRTSPEEALLSSISRSTR